MNFYKHHLTNLTEVKLSQLLTLFVLPFRCGRPVPKTSSSIIANTSNQTGSEVFQSTNLLNSTSTKRLTVKLALLISLTCFSTAQSYGQFQDLAGVGMERLRPPSPNVASFTKFGNIPVGESTGIPKISIPVYSYTNESNRLSLPISLDYHAGGIRVDEVASSVGLGWTLNCGGVISRVVRGIADECGPGFIGSTFPADPEDGNYPLEAPAFKPFVKVFNHKLDIEADVFSYNFNGISGKFTYGRDGSILMINDSRIKISKEVTTMTDGVSMITMFTVTDLKGIVYTFAAAETTILPGGLPFSNYTSSWFLTKIEYPNTAKSINLEYEDVDIATYTTSISQVQVGHLYPTGGSPMESFHASQMSVHAKRLKSVAFPNGVILSCTYSTTVRTDLPNDNMLKKITITNTLNNQTRGILLDQDYSLAGRATLLKVTPFSGADAQTTSNPYIFNYSGGLPARLSNQQDHWGYSTQHTRDENTSGRIPREIFPASINGIYEFSGINRDADLNCIAGTLKKMIYPSGGYTIFEMEPNQAYDGWLNQEFFVQGGDPNYVEDRTESYLLSRTNNSPAYQDFTFTYNDDIPAAGPDFKLKIESGSIGGCQGCLVRLEIFDIDDNNRELTSIDFTDPYNRYVIKSLSIPGFRKGKSYKFRYSFSGSIRDFYGTAYLMYKVHPLNSGTVYRHNQPYVGGLRAKRISDYDGKASDPLFVREFEYLNPTGTRSSGVLTSYPVYTRALYYEGVINIQIANKNYSYQNLPPLVLLRQSTPVLDLIYTGGTPVEYYRIVEYQNGPASSNGKIERTFETTSSGRGPLGDFPPLPAENLEWLHGQLKTETTYNSSGAVLKRIVNEYNRFVHPNYLSIDTFLNFVSYATAPVMFNIPDDFTATPGMTVNSPQVSAYNPIWYAYNDYLPHAGRSELKKTKITYFNSVDDSISSEISYTYDPNDYQLRSEKATNSKNDEHISLYSYPADMVASGQDGGGTYQAMVTANMLNPVIETSRKINGTQIERKRKSYVGLAGGSLILPYQEEQQKLNYPAYTALNYLDYDQYGNLLALQKPSGTIQSFKWDRLGEHAVAVCSNASQAEFCFEDFEGETAWNIASGGGHTGERYATSYTINWARPNLRNYLISYWYLSEGVWKYSGLLNYSGPSYTLTGGIGYDDVRIYPSDAELITYTFDPLSGMTSMTDANGLITYYEYDPFQRLSFIKDQNGKIIKHVEYHYQNE